MLESNQTILFILVPIIIGLIFFVLPISLIIIRINNVRNWVQLDGRILKIHTVMVGDDIGQTYDVEYIFNGQPYIAYGLSSDLVLDGKAIGEFFPLLVNPSAPEKAYGRSNKNDPLYKVADLLHHFWRRKDT